MTGPAIHMWTIRTNPNDEMSLFGLPVDERGNLCVFIFNTEEHAKDFAGEQADRPANSVVAPFEAPDIRRVLEHLAKNTKATHVCTDPILCSTRWMDRQTLTIPEYLQRLG